MHFKPKNWDACYVHSCPLTQMPSLDHACSLVQVWEAVHVLRFILEKKYQHNATGSWHGIALSQHQSRKCTGVGRLKACWNTCMVQARSYPGHHELDHRCQHTSWIWLWLSMFQAFQQALQIGAVSRKCFWTRWLRAHHDASKAPLKCCARLDAPRPTLVYICSMTLSQLVP